LFTTNPTWTDLGTNPDLLNEKPASNYLSCSTAFKGAYCLHHWGDECVCMCARALTCVRACVCVCGGGGRAGERVGEQGTLTMPCEVESYADTQKFVHRTAYSRVLLQKLVVTQLVKFPTFYGT
jgi:hypothetical protein